MSPLKSCTVPFWKPMASSARPSSTAKHVACVPPLPLPVALPPPPEATPLTSPRPPPPAPDEPEPDATEEPIGSDCALLVEVGGLRRVIRMQCSWCCSLRYSRRSEFQTFRICPEALRPLGPTSSSCEYIVEDESSQRNTVRQFKLINKYCV